MQGTLTYLMTVLYHQISHHLQIHVLYTGSFFFTCKRFHSILNSPRQSWEWRERVWDRNLPSLKFAWWQQGWKRGQIFPRVYTVYNYIQLLHMQCYLYIKRNKLYMQRSTGITVLNMHWLQISDALAVIENKSRD